MRLRFTKINAISAVISLNFSIKIKYEGRVICTEGSTFFFFLNNNNTTANVMDNIEPIDVKTEINVAADVISPLALTDDKSAINSHTIANSKENASILPPAMSF